MDIAFIPYSSKLLKNKIFNSDEYDLGNSYGPDRPAFFTLCQELKSRGHHVGTVDEIPPEEADVCVMIDINFYYLNRIYQAENNPRLIYLMREPPTFVPFNTLPRIRRYLDIFDHILTWNPNIASYHHKCSEYRLPYCYPETQISDKPYEDRKLLCNISGRKYSQHPNELYSSREDLISYFDAKNPEDFSHYGVGWDSTPGISQPLSYGQFRPTTYSTYKGKVNTKKKPYHTHRFALSFENVTGINGYVSEKIFDCLRYGIVPIYWGSNDISNYVPESAFIHYPDLGSPEELHTYLRNVSDEEYTQYIKSAKKFLQEYGEDFGPKKFGQRLADLILESPKESSQSIPEYLTEEVTTMAKLDYLRYHHSNLTTMDQIFKTIQLFRESPRMTIDNPELFYYILNKFGYY